MCVSVLLNCTIDWTYWSCNSLVSIIQHSVESFASECEMSSESASHSGTDSNSNAPKPAPAVMAEMESKDKTGCATKTHVPTKAKLRTGLKNWTMSSSVINLNAAESERDYKHGEPPKWKCIICSKLINTTPVYQVRYLSYNRSQLHLFPRLCFELQNLICIWMLDGQFSACMYMMPFIGNGSKNKVRFHDVALNFVSLFARLL